LFLQHHKEPDNLLPEHPVMVSRGKLGALFALSWLLISWLPSISHGQDVAQSEPWGRQLQFAASTLGGNGAQIGLVSARSVYTTEVVVLSDLDPLWRTTDRRARVVVMPGISLRMLGFERLIGGAAYRGFDIGIGLRAGPGLTFDTEETSAERDRRFELVLEPFLRFTSAQSGRLSWLLELGSTRPAFRVGIWVTY